MLKKIFVFTMIASLSLVVSADCRQTCEDNYNHCLSIASSPAGEKVCAQDRRECELECSMNGM